MTAREAGDDYQVLLDRIRRVVGERRFALGTQIVAGVSDPIEVSAGYARIAEAAIEVGAAATVAEFVARHGRVPDSELVRSEEHTSELQSLMRISYAVFCLKKKRTSKRDINNQQ